MIISEWISVHNSKQAQVKGKLQVSDQIDILTVKYIIIRYKTSRCALNSGGGAISGCQANSFPAWQASNFQTRLLTEPTNISEGKSIVILVHL